MYGRAVLGRSAEYFGLLASGDTKYLRFFSVCMRDCDGLRVSNDCGCSGSLKFVNKLRGVSV